MEDYFNALQEKVKNEVGKQKGYEEKTLDLEA